MNVYNRSTHNYQNLGKLKCPTIGEWINQMQDTYTLELNSVKTKGKK